MRPSSTTDLTRSPARFELALVGGGLQNALIALAVLARRPGTAIAVIERETHFGGNHTWCLHARDAGPEEPAWLTGLIVQRWPAYGVRFPDLERRIEQPYRAITSERLDAVLSATLSACPNAQRVSGVAVTIGERHLELGDGRTIEADHVFDARGPERPQASTVSSQRGPQPGGAPSGYQKFLGLELEVTPGSAPALPLLMDATVQQQDGFRFLYTLPLSPSRVLVEDTYYSLTPSLDVERLRASVLEYARAQGMIVDAVVREEQGILPIPLTTPRLGRAPGGPWRAGIAGGYFHPATGYTLPAALRLAHAVAEAFVSRDVGAELARRVTALQAALRPQQAFGVLLNRLLFRGLPPELGYRALERFYRLDQDLIARFYALDTTPQDRLRVVCGRPPRGFRFQSFVTGGPPG